MLPISVEQHGSMYHFIAEYLEYIIFKGFNTMYELYTTLQNASHAVQICV